ncbi:isocitrate lyase/phosphoenolpyruvate mutase family protein [Mycobacterium sp. URHB0021]|jgi:2-methylisocitrate lyase-like PEP mutase family enzyme
MKTRAVTALRRAFDQDLQSGRPIFSPGAYDALSACLVAQAGFDAVYIGSFATAASVYGLPDVGLLTLIRCLVPSKRRESTKVV